MIAVLALALQTELVLEEVGGLLVFEAEAAVSRGDWRRESAMPGFTGEGYLTWVGPDLFGAPGKDAIAWTLHVGRPGRYLLRMRNRHDFADSTLQNDCFTRMDDGPWLKTFSSTRGEWTWATRHEHEGGDKPPAVYDLGAGLHTFRISGRSKGFSIDRIHLALEGAPGAEDAAAPASPSVFDAMAGPGPYAALAPLARKLRSGREAGGVLRTLRGKLDEPEGKAMFDALQAFLARRADSARSLEPAEKVARLGELASLFEEDEAGAALAKEVDALRSDPAIQSELKAAALWRKVEEAVARLRPYQGRRDPKAEGFRRLNGPAMASIAAACRRLADAHPGTRAAKRAEDLLSLYR